MGFIIQEMKVIQGTVLFSTLRPGLFLLNVPALDLHEMNGVDKCELLFLKITIHQLFRAA